MLPDELVSKEKPDKLATVEAEARAKAKAAKADEAKAARLAEEQRKEEEAKAKFELEKSMKASEVTPCLLRAARIARRPRLAALHEHAFLLIGAPPCYPTVTERAHRRGEGRSKAGRRRSKGSGEGPSGP